LAYPHLPFQRAWRAVIPVSQQRVPVFYPNKIQADDSRAPV